MGDLYTMYGGRNPFVGLWSAPATTTTWATPAGTTTSPLYIIRRDSPERIAFVRGWYDKLFSCTTDITRAVRFARAESAAKLIQERGEVYEGRYSFSIVPVKVTTIAAKFEEKIAPARDVFRVRDEMRGRFVQYVPATNGFLLATHGTPPSDFETAQDAWDALDKRMRIWGTPDKELYGVVRHHIPARPTGERMLVEPAETVVEII